MRSQFCTGVRGFEARVYLTRLALEPLIAQNGQHLSASFVCARL
jgi:hypothetical protein